MILRMFLGLLAIASIIALGCMVRIQRETIAEQGESIGVLTAANAAADAALKDLRAFRQQEDALLADTAEKIDKLTTRIQGLDRITREALRNAPHLTLASPLPADAADALCLQWRAAGGLGSAYHPGDAAGDPAARAGHSPAAGSGGPGTVARNGAGADCESWRRMTVADAVEWNGLLLRHAGLEREDKAALRAWAAGVGR